MLNFYTSSNSTSRIKTGHQQKKVSRKKEERQDRRGEWIEADFITLWSWDGWYCVMVWSEQSSTPRWGTLRAAAPTPLGKLLYCLLSYIESNLYICTKCFFMHFVQSGAIKVCFRENTLKLWCQFSKSVYPAAEDRVLPSPDRRSWGRASPRTGAPSHITETRTTTEDTFTIRTTMTGLTSGRILRAGEKEVNTIIKYSFDAKLSYAT